MMTAEVERTMTMVGYLIWAGAEASERRVLGLMYSGSVRRAVVLSDLRQGAEPLRSLSIVIGPSRVQDFSDFIFYCSIRCAEARRIEWGNKK